MNASDRLKSTGGCLFGAIGMLVLFAIPAVLLFGAAWLSEHFLPWFFLASLLALAFELVIVLPLSIFRPCRGFSCLASMIVSYVFGVTLWLWALLLTIALWGWVAVIVGLLLFGVGIVPIAFFAALFNGMWSVVLQIVVLFVLTMGTRMFAFWIAGKADSPPLAEEAIALGR